MTSYACHDVSLGSSNTKESSDPMEGRLFGNLNGLLSALPSCTDNGKLVCPHRIIVEITDVLIGNNILKVYECDTCGFRMIM